LLAALHSRIFECAVERQALREQASFARAAERNPPRRLRLGPRTVALSARGRDRLRACRALSASSRTASLRAGGTLLSLRAAAALRASRTEQLTRSFHPRSPARAGARCDCSHGLAHKVAPGRQTTRRVPVAPRRAVTSRDPVEGPARPPRRQPSRTLEPSRWAQLYFAQERAQAAPYQARRRRERRRRAPPSPAAGPTSSPSSRPSSLVGKPPPQLDDGPPLSARGRQPVRVLRRHPPPPHRPVAVGSRRVSRTPHRPLRAVRLPPRRLPRQLRRARARVPRQAATSMAVQDGQARQRIVRPLPRQLAALVLPLRPG